MTFEELRALVEQHCADLLELPGEVYFGSLDALSQPNGIAIVGLNPGGSSLPPMRENLARYPLGDKKVFSGYLDQCWHDPWFSRYETCDRCAASLAKDRKVHQQPHQRTVEALVTALGADLRKALALNALWIQTRNAVELKRLLAQLQLPRLGALFQRRFFPVIQELLDACDVRLVLCLGNGASDSAFELFRQALGVPRSAVEHVSRDYRDGRHFMHGKRLYFGIAHPSMHQTRPAGVERLQALWRQLA